MVPHVSAIASLAAFWLASSAAAQSGASLNFDGSNDRVTVPYDSSFPTEVFSISAWIKTAVPNHRAAIIARGEDDNSWDLSWHLYLEPGGELRLMVEDTAMDNHCYPYQCFSTNPQPTCTIIGNDQVADDQWHHVAATRDSGGTLVLYVDGAVIASCTQTGVPSVDNFQDLTIGCTHGALGPPPGGIEPPIWFFEGQIDDAAMWNVALSGAQVLSVRQAGPGAVTAGLTGWWRFNEASGQDVADASGSGNDGVLGVDSGLNESDPEWIVPACPADTDGNGAVDVDDLIAVILDWGMTGTSNGGDVDGSGQVDVDDLVTVILAWGPC